MDKFEVVLLIQALKFYQKSSEDLTKRLNHCFEELEQNPFHGPNIKLLKTPKGKKAYRYRIGDYRVIYDVDKTNKKIGVHLILPRTKAYRNF